MLGLFAFPGSVSPPSPGFFYLCFWSPSLGPSSPLVLFVSWNFLCLSSSVAPVFACSPGFSLCSRFSPQFSPPCAWPFSGFL